ncbi:hypothetical protein D3C80_903460 [compost metagenome]
MVHRQRRLDLEAAHLGLGVGRDQGQAQQFIDLQVGVIEHEGRRVEAQPPARQRRLGADLVVVEQFGTQRLGRLGAGLGGAGEGAGLIAAIIADVEPHVVDRLDRQGQLPGRFLEGGVSIDVIGRARRPQRNAGRGVGAVLVVQGDLMHFALVMRPARADGQLPDIGEGDRGLAEHGVAGVGGVLIEGRVAAKRRRCDRQRRLHHEPLGPLHLFAEHVDAGDPVDRRTGLGGQAEFLAELLGRLAGAVVDRQGEARERQAAQVVAPAVVVVAIGGQGDDVEMLGARPLGAPGQAPVFPLLIIVRRREALPHVQTGAQIVHQRRKRRRR